jgi:murein L,D-transpeptidase YcbB/YkuD
MKNFTLFSINFCLIILTSIFYSCGNAPKPIEVVLVENPDKLDGETSKGIHQFMDYALQNKGKVDDSTFFHLTKLVNAFYNTNEYSNVWSKNGKWQPIADSLLLFIQNAALHGLSSKDYHVDRLLAIKEQLDTDSVQSKNAILWSKADLLMTDASLYIISHLKYGRLLSDTNAIIDNAGVKGELLLQHFNSLLVKPSFILSLSKVEPTNLGYWELKNGIKNFVDSMDKRVFTYLVYPIKKNDQKDSLLFVKNFQKRLSEGNFIEFNDKLPDSLDLATAIKKFQRKKGAKQDGIITAKLIRSLNTNDVERFNRIAITLDRYKMLPDSMPEKYIWVNLPAYYLQLWDHDTVVFQSKIICGKPETRTPLLQSNITDMVTYPTWTVPSSIIEKQYLPKLKVNPNYLSKIGLKLVDNHGEFIDPVKIKWAKYKKGIPYKIVQNSGDDNALGVIKFNFKNPYAVYLHDTNQRYLFKNSSRALSHGCVRVQDWEKLAYYIAKNDSLNLVTGESLQYTTDSIKSWISSKKHKWIGVRNQIPLFITYFGCEGKGGKIKFYEDIYLEDKVMREKYFPVK